MGSKRESGVFWSLLLAGLFLLAAASAAEARRERDTKKEEDIQWCKKDCAWKFGQDSRKVRDCKEHCERRHSPGGRLPEDDEPNSDDDEVIFKRCERQCKHQRDDRKRQHCIEDCFYGHGQGEGDGGRCREQCERYPRGSYGREQCLGECKSKEEEMNHHGKGGYKDECKRPYEHGYERQQCVRDCESPPHHGGGGAGGRGREGDERQQEHGSWEMRVAGVENLGIFDEYLIQKIMAIIM